MRWALGLLTLLIVVAVLRFGNLAAATAMIVRTLADLLLVIVFVTVVAGVAVGKKLV